MSQKLVEKIPKITWNCTLGLPWLWALSPVDTYRVVSICVFLATVFLPSANEVAERYCFHKRVSRIVSRREGVHIPWEDTPSQTHTPPLAGRHPPYWQAETPPLVGTSPAGRHPPRRDGYWSGRYASY